MRGTDVHLPIAGRGKIGLWLKRRRGEIRLAVRVAVAGVLAFALAQFLDLAQGYWAVLTAVIVMQASVGGSLKATLDRLTGTLGGAVYGAVIATLVPRGGALSLGLALALSLAPLALVAALDARFRVAPITAVIVLLSPTGQAVSPIAFTIDRVLEIGLGSVVALAVSLLVLPARAHGLLAETTSRLLTLLAEFLGVVLGGLAKGADKPAIFRLQVATRKMLGTLETAAEEAKRERRSYLTDDPDPDPIVRTSLRLRNDLIMIARAAMEPLGAPLASRLSPALEDLSQAGAAFLRDIAAAFATRTPPPLLESLEAALRTYLGEVAALRREGVLRELPAETLSQLFALGFALEQLHQDLKDLANRAAEFARAAATPARSPPPPNRKP
jgi:uncharacterized membrane protein YccC